MTIDAARDLARQGDGAASDAVTVAFSDAAAGVHGLLRAGLDPDGRASVFAVLFDGREPVAAEARGDLDPRGSDWSALQAGNLSLEVVAPLERWHLRWHAEDASAELDLAATSAPAAVPAVGGMAGYEQLCHLTGTVEVGGRRVAVGAPGQRGHSWGTPDWRALDLTRSVAVWLGDGDGVTLAAARPAGAGGHDEEQVSAALISRGEPTPVADPRLSTTYDGDGHQRRAGLELWVSEDDGFPHRLAGEVLCGSTLDLGPLRLDVAFFSWRADGRDGTGRYDILTKS